MNCSTLTPCSAPSRALALVALLVCLWGSGSALTPARGSEASERQEKLNGGYYLLYHVCEDESQLPMLLIVKDAPPEIEKYADQVSQTAKASNAALKRMQNGGVTPHFDKNPLPLIEREVRESIKGDKQHQLLFGTSGPEFIRALLVSQIEADSYALNLAKVLSDQEKDPDRVKSLKHISARWLAMRNETFRLLRNY